VHFFNNQNKKTRQIVKRLFLAPKERSFNLQSPHPGLFSCVFQSKKQFKLNLGGENILQYILSHILLFCSALKEKRGLPKSSSFKKSIYFLELFCLVCICSLGPRFAFKKKSSSEGCWIEFKVQKERKPPLYLKPYSTPLAATYNRISTMI